MSKIKSYKPIYIGIFLLIFVFPIGINFFIEFGLFSYKPIKSIFGNEEWFIFW